MPNEIKRSLEPYSSFTIFPVKICFPWIKALEELHLFRKNNPGVLRTTQLHRFSTDVIDRNSIYKQDFDLTKNTLVSIDELKQHAELWNTVPLTKKKETNNELADPYYYFLYLTLTHKFGFQYVENHILRVVSREKPAPSAYSLMVAEVLTPLIFKLYTISVCSLGTHFIAELNGELCQHAKNCPVRKLGKRLPPMPE